MKKQSNKPQLQTLKGFRDFLPATKQQRDWVTQQIKSVFEKFGFAPLETPTLEYASLLLGKYGDEADKLVYSFEDRGGREVALRYDQTVPSARVLSEYQNELPKYFRRYQIQNVFRADKPQKGRFREFTQCDVDIFGTNSPLADAEILACTYAVYKQLGFKNVELKINDRQVLMEILAPLANDEVDIFSIIQSIDKLDKLPPEKVVAELLKKGLAEEEAESALSKLAEAQPSENLAEIMNQAINLGIPQENLVFSPQLARGLDYYTGMIFEVTSSDYAVGSMGGGGRYNNLIQELGGPEMPAVGVGLGFDRIVEACLELELIPQGIEQQTQVMVSVFDEKTLDRSLEVTKQFREAGIKTLLYPQLDKLGKQFKYADQLNIPFAVVIGENELQENKLTLKNLATREQSLLSVDEAVKMINKQQ
jgi:histidyl-tRNA synthetase